MNAPPGPREDIGPTFVPQLRAAVALNHVGDESVLYEEDTGNLHRLDAVATAVCRRFEGRTSVSSAVAALVDEFDASATVIEADVVSLLHALWDLGLLTDERREQRTVAYGS